MKICIPVKEDKQEKSEVFDHFGSAPVFIIYDNDTQNYTGVPNINKHHFHGMCQPLRVLAGYNINIVVCQGMGLRAVERLNAGGIKAYKAKGKTVTEIINNYNEGNLEEITPDTACSDHTCH